MPSKPPSLKPAPKRKAWHHRASAEERGYGAAHRAIRKQVLREEPLCRLCLPKGIRSATVIADHIIPLSQGGPTIRSNYQGLCKPCSDAKTRDERNAAGGWSKSPRG